MVGKIFVTTALIGLTSYGFTANAQEQDTASNAIDRCASETDAAKRIACLEAALRGTPATPKPVAVQPVIAEPVAAPRVTPTPTVAIVEAPPRAEVEVAAAPELGSEQVAARTATKQSTPAPEAAKQQFSVRSTRKVPYEKLEVSLANGQVWRQIKGDNQKIRVPRKYRDDLTVEIWNAPVSGYKMRLTELKRTIRVERLK